MADKDVEFQFLLVFIIFLFPLRSLQGPIYPKCGLSVGKGRNFSITRRVWEYRAEGYTYKISLCEPLDAPASCIGASVCKLKGNKDNGVTLGQKNSNTTSLFADGTGFSVEYQDGVCEGKSGGKLTTRLLMRCGKFMGYPELIDQYTTDTKCVVVFEFITNEACKTPPTAAEVPCSFYSDIDNKRRDLTPLIKTKGGHEVVSQNSSYDFHINICREITPEALGGHTHGCPNGSASCRRQIHGSNVVSIGNVAKGSTPMPGSNSKYEIVIWYNTSTILPGCPGKSFTKVTLVCPKELHQAGVRGPVMTSDVNCLYEIFWETQYACPQETLMANDSCVLSNEFVQFDLTPLRRANLHNYKVNGTGAADGKVYQYFINVCGSTNIPNCKPDGYNASVCQLIPDTREVVSLGVYYKQTLRYADGQLTLSYKSGKTCHSGFKRETIITFKCNPTIEQGNPKFSSESHCLYLFEWETRYACPPSRRTGTACRVTNDAGVRYDLSELVRIHQPNWLAIDGQTSSSDKMLYINVCGKLSKQNKTSRCDPSAAVCMVLKDGTTTNLGRYSMPPTLNPDYSIKLVYTNGDECVKGTKRKSTITFVCQPGDLTSPPVLVSQSQDNCQYTFMWKTAAACSLGVNTGDKCKVQDQEAGYVFDLNPVAHEKRFGKTFFEANSTGKYRYFLQVCVPFNGSGCINAGACQTTKNSGTKDPHVIGRSNSHLYYYDGIIKLTYGDGEVCRHNNRARKSHISFMCDPQATFNGAGQPTFDREDDCTYHFRWFTKYACPAKVIECAARFGSDQYDLSSLVKTDDNWESTGRLGTFYINICRSLNLKPEVSKCRGTSAVCLIDKSGKVHNLGAVSGALRVITQGTVIITYTGGDTCTSSFYKTEIKFICVKGATDTSPAFKGLDKCTYKFRWETATACPITNVVGSGCAVQDPKSDTVFNLYPLSLPGDSPYNLTLPDGRNFLLNICGSLAKGRCKSDQTADIASCMTDTDKTKYIIGMKSLKLEFRGETLMLTYRDGDRDGTTGLPRITRIRFYCNPKIPLGQPQYIEQASEKEGEVFYFDFQTSLACSAKQVQCAIVGPQGLKYDLNPLALTSGNWDAVDSRPAYKHLHYYINICRPFNPDVGTRCPGGAIGACQVDHSTKKGHNLGYIQSNPQIASNGEVTLRYFGGDACHSKYNRSTRINFHCSQTMGSPIFTTETPECEYVFDWQTPSACNLSREYGSDCGVKDRQYDYQFNLSSLYNPTKDYSFVVGKNTILLNVCNKLKSTACKGSNVGACLKAADPTDNKVLGILTKHLTYFDGEINLRYANADCSVEITFDCGPNRGVLAYESTNGTCDYKFRWSTNLACRPVTHVQCSIRQDSSSGRGDLQYDFTALSKSDRNWKAISTSSGVSSVSYYINVCRSLVQTGDAAKCPSTAGVCKVDSSKKSYKSLGFLKKRPQQKNNNLYLLYEGGDPCDNGKPASAKILMECGTSPEAAPQFMNEYPDTCLYEFLWTTKYACPINTVNQTITNDCRAINPTTNYVFDINRLRNKHDYTTNDLTGHYFVINVCGPLLRKNDCDDQTASCQLQSGSSSFHYNAGIASKSLIYRDGVLSLTYTGGDVCHHSNTHRQTIISFVCNSTAQDSLGQPVFVAETDQCTYYFAWHTSLACERKVECSPVVYGTKSNTKYSLRKLAREHGNWEAVTADGPWKGRYYINVCRPLVPIPGINCPAGASACKASDGKVDSLGRAMEPPEIDDNGNVVIVYQRSDHSMSTRIQMTCSRGSLGKPVLTSVDQNTYVFNWATSAACPEVDVPDYEHCSVYDNSTEYTFNISPLKTINSLSYVTFSATGGSTVFVSVCGSLSSSAGKQCQGAGVCWVDKDKKNSTALGMSSYHSITYLHDENMLLLKYCNKACKDARTISRIMFICDEKATSFDQRSLESLGGTGANIIWRTNLVCPPAQQECVYVDKTNMYDLQLLSSRSRSWSYISSKGYRFWFNICRGITGVPDCPSSASVCGQLTSSSSKTLTLGFTRTQQFVMGKNNWLLLNYTGQKGVHGCSKTIPATVVFQFTCGQHVGKPTLVDISWSTCIFAFSWKTVAACEQDREELHQSNCRVKHPLTHRTIDFSKLHSGTTAVEVSRISKGHGTTKYYLNLCGTIKGGSGGIPSECTGFAVCSSGTQTQKMNAKRRQLFYEDYMFELWITTDFQCSKVNTKYTTIVINFQCSDTIGVGKPVFEYESASCHLVFSWSTSLICTKDQSGIIVDPTSKELSQSSAGKKAGIAFGIIFALLALAAIVFVLHNPRRRQALSHFVRWNVRKYLHKGENVDSPVYRYQKITVEEDNEGDLLLGISDNEDEEEEEDDDLLTV